MDKYNELSNLYNEFIFESFNIEETNDKCIITYEFNIPNLIIFHPTIEIDKFEINDFTKYLVFHIGLVELISYWKCTCSKNVIIKAGYINENQIEFFKKLYFNGLGELFYTNSIDLDYDNFMNITCTKEKENIDIPTYNGLGNLIPIGGGKDSNVTLEILKDSFNTNDIFIINPKEIHIKMCKSSRL